MFRTNSEYLFQGQHCFEVCQHAVRSAVTSAKGFSENAILGRTTDDLVDQLISSLSISIPILKEEDTWIEEGEIEEQLPARSSGFFDESHSRATKTVRRHIVTYHVPFDGNGAAFQYEPSSRTVPGPRGIVIGQEVLIRLESNGQTAEQLNASFSSRIHEIRKHLNTLGNDVKGIPRDIEASVRHYIDERRAELLRSKNLVANLGFPMKKRESAPSTYRAPDVRRKVSAIQTKVVAPFKPEPTLDESDYQHILGVMDNMTKVMERSPHTFHKMGEEDIRQHFLVQLNGQYEGQATGETFNFEGKTDILIRSEGRNIFIAECKFWHGEKGFAETVDQLLSYLTWRDTKTALVVFNKNKNLSGVLEAIKAAMPNHPQYKRGPKIEGETRFRYILASTSDPNREIIVTVLVYDVPSAS